RFENLGDDADDVRERGHVRHHRRDTALGQIAVTDLASFRRAEHAGFADAERRKVVMEHERLLAFPAERIDDLRIATRAERRDNEWLRLATGKERRAMSAREQAGPD